MAVSTERPQPRPELLAIDVYVPGASGAGGAAKIHKLSSNESPLGPSPHAIAAFRAEADTLALYPDGSATRLRAAIADRYGLDKDRILCGNGSDELLALLAHVFLSPGDEAVYSQYGFVQYPIAIRAAGGVPVVAPETDFTADVDSILSKIGPKTRMVFLANPNNPTGTYLAASEVKRLHAALPRSVLLVIDAAYAEYVQRNDYVSGIELVADYQNVVMTRTFSKIHGLAALRIGWIYAPSEIIDVMNRIRGPFNVNSAALAAGVAAVQDSDHVQAAIVHNQQWLPFVTDALKALGLDVLPSVGNFVLVRFPGGRLMADAAYAALSAEGFILRPVRAYGLHECLRLTIGDEEANRGVIAALGRFMKKIMAQRNLGPARSEAIFDRLTIIGAGLIGSSIARAVRQVGAARSIVIADASADVIERARALNLGDVYFTSARESAADADIVIFCTPVGANAEIAARVAPALKPGAIVSDVGSVKGAVVAAIGPHLPEGVHFVPAHPVAGTEQSGPEAGFASLFVNRWCILTPPEGVEAAATERVAALWSAMGANVEVMTPEHHDLVLAITSHVPHLIAYNIVGTAADLEAVTRSEVIKFSAGGFRDFTRIAASDPTMWRDVFLNNKDAVLEMLGRFTEDLTALQRMIRRGDGDGLFELFTRTRAIRRGIVEVGQETNAPDFGRQSANEAEAGREIAGR